MRVLFTTDVHGDMDVYRAFAVMLKEFDIGIIAGDLLEEFLPLNDAIEYGLKDKDLLEELQADDYDEVAEFDKELEKALHDKNSMNRKGLEMKRLDIIRILEEAERKIYYIRGNHDIADWDDTCYMVNIENRKVEFDSISLYGLKEEFKLAFSKYRYSSKAARNIDKKTILVCHSPPYKIMDEAKIVRRKDHRIVVTHVGNKNILKLINKRHPLFCLCGHVHEGIGMQKNIINGGCYRHKQFVSIDTDKNEVKFIKY